MLNMLRFFPFNSTFQENPSDDLTLESTTTTLPDEGIVNSCRCCGTLIKLPGSLSKYKCLVCQSSLLVQGRFTSQDMSHQFPKNDAISLDMIKQKIKECEAAQFSNKELRTPHLVYKPLEDLIKNKFSDYEILNSSFIQGNRKPSLKYLNVEEAKETFNIISNLPTTRPYFMLLIVVNDMLRKPPSDLSRHEDLIWLLILFELPTLSDCLYHNRMRKGSSHPKSKLETPEIKALSYEIIKRLIGYLANSDAISVEQLARKFSSLHIDNFSFKVQLINLYITFHLTRLINKYYDSKTMKIVGSNSPVYSEYCESSKLNSTTPVESTAPSTRQQQKHSTSPRRFMRLPISFQTGFISWTELINERPSTDPKPSEFKLRVQHYGSEWHIRTSARLLSIFYISNRNKLPHFSFYNALVDFITIKQDYEVWQQRNSKKLIYDILSTANDLCNNQFTFCSYPFLLTLGMKISILEYEAKKLMERKAEETFIKALDKRRALDINLRISIRRSNISHDSLKCLEFATEDDLKKSLKVEFVGEPGIDIGGLKKEWFSLITKELFNVENGLFYYEESNFCWFTMETFDLKHLELYHMVGIILGLAIYNSTILDLKFPLALYKKLINKKIRFEDYQQMFPNTSKGLQKLLDYNEEDVENFGLYFDTTFKNLFGDIITKELIFNGSKIKVTNFNRKEYVNKWVDFYMNQSIKLQFEKFYEGFHKVIGGNALSLFSAKEIEMIICGNEEIKIDCESFKSITKYSGWSSTIDALESNIVQWFWKWFYELNYEQHKKFFIFVFGTDRIPATGISTMSFKITKLKNLGNMRKLPIAHTCFNELCLFDYSTEEEFLKKLNISIYESEGFGLR